MSLALQTSRCHYALRRRCILGLLCLDGDRISIKNITFKHLECHGKQWATEASPHVSLTEASFVSLHFHMQGGRHKWAYNGFSFLACFSARQNGRSHTALVFFLDLLSVFHTTINHDLRCFLPAWRRRDIMPDASPSFKELLRSFDTTPPHDAGVTISFALSFLPLPLMVISILSHHRPKPSSIWSPDTHHLPTWYPL